MAFKTQCPHCKTWLEIDEQYAGMNCQCPQCQQTFVAQSAAPAPAPTPAPAPAPAPDRPARPKMSLGLPRQHQQQANAPAGNGHRIICPKCGRVLNVSQSGSYSCRCGTALQLLDSGAIHVHMVIPKHNPSYWIILVGILVGLTAMGGLIIVIVLPALIAAIS